MNYLNKNIVIIGLGKTGLSCLNFFLKKGIIPKIMDTRLCPPEINKIPQKITYYLGGLNKNWLFSADLIILSPGISLYHPIINQAILAGIEIIGDIELFCRETNKPIIAITGSNGKSTVASLVTEIIKKSGCSVGLGGNIGIPALTLLEKSFEIYVLELSSFQLETVKSLKAKVATILNTSHDHIDRYPLGFNQYHNTKLKIYENCDICIVNAHDNMTHLKTKYNKIISFGSSLGDYSLKFIKNEIWLQLGNKQVMNSSSIKLMGQHNYTNILASLAIADVIGISRKYSIPAITEFHGLPHRFQLIHKNNGVCWINDSKATNINSTQVALSCLTPIIKGKIWLLLGGESKTTDFSILIPYLKQKNIRIYCFGRDKAILATINPNVTTCTDTMEAALYQIIKQVNFGDVVLLSPACSSLDQFRNFEDRGNLFIKLVQKIS